MATTYTNTGTFAATFYANTAPQPSSGIITWAAEMAYEYINSRLDGVYTVPFPATYPVIIVKISDLLTRCGVGKLSRGVTPTIPKASKREAIMDECALAVTMLDDLCSLRSTIPGVTPILGANSNPIRTDLQPIFDVDTSDNHSPPSRLIEQIESERDT